jgi:hypothetical protein
MESVPCVPAGDLSGATDARIRRQVSVTPCGIKVTAICPSVGVFLLLLTRTARACPFSRSRGGFCSPMLRRRRRAAAATGRPNTYGGAEAPLTGARIRGRWKSRAPATRAVAVGAGGLREGSAIGRRLGAPLRTGVRSACQAVPLPAEATRALPGLAAGCHLCPPAAANGPPGRSRQRQRPRFRAKTTCHRPPARTTARATAATPHAPRRAPGMACSALHVALRAGDCALAASDRVRHAAPRWQALDDRPMIGHNLPAVEGRLPALRRHLTLHLREREGASWLCDFHIPGRGASGPLRSAPRLLFWRYAACCRPPATKASPAARPMSPTPTCS